MAHCLLVAGVACCAGPVLPDNIVAQKVVWDANDDRPIPEPAHDPTGDYIWWDGTRNMTFYPAGKVLDLGALAAGIGEGLGIVDEREAGNVNALDEVPDSTWFTNRHGLSRLSAEELARGPNDGPPPADTGPLRVRSGKALGESPGFVIEDEAERRYLIKFDTPEYREMATGTEMVASKILHAAGWNVPEYHLIRLDPQRLVLVDDATTRDRYRRKRPMTREDLESVLGRAARGDDGRFRAVASRFIPGEAKGPFRTRGVRTDDPNDTVPHQHRRDLRGLRIVAAWINYTDARRGNFYDTFVPVEEAGEGMGYLRHYLLDFSNAFGSGNVALKDAKYGYEYVFDPGVVLKRLLGLGFVHYPWEQPGPIEHREIGHFTDEYFDPVRWRTSYPQPLFDELTERDELWGSKLVASFTDDDIDVVVAAGEWSDPEVARTLARILRGRRDRIAAVYFDTARINPADRFRIDGDQLRFCDWGVYAGIVPPDLTRYRYRFADRPWEVLRLDFSDHPTSAAGRRCPLHSDPWSARPSGSGILRLESTRSGEAVVHPEIALPEIPSRLELQTSHDAGRTWSPSTYVSLRSGAPLTVTGIERESR